MHPLQRTLISTHRRTRQIVRVARAVWRGEVSRYPAFVEAFERRYAETVGRAYGLSLCNGTSALEAALFAAGVGPGDEVIVPSCTFHASIDPIVNAGAVPVFADVEEKSWTLSPVEVQAKITPRTRAVIAVHLWGIPAAMGPLLAVLKDRNITLIEDVSHAHGARWGDRACGAFGRFGVFSLQGSKPVAAGEGAMVVTDHWADFVRLSMWGHFDRHSAHFGDIDAEEFCHTGVGYKRRMAPLGALLADVDLDYLSYYNRLKRRNVGRLDAELGDVPGIAIARPSREAVRGGFYQGYPILLLGDRVSRATVQRTLKAEGIDAIAYPFPLHHRLRVYTDLAYRHHQLTGRQVAPAPPAAYSLPVTEQLADHLILLAPRHLLTLSQTTLNTLRRILSAL
ncbi:DegT/DnrJ/EryC1/StrS family aminotransferase [Nodosilinea sp. PGN35]|uniref:DegT/DnrJ/EryC1/StrS family aminotransferase n=1 Tax=Nodosilinea sp. PGN35 TaxID=3020489 RepID=UPI0023B26333|nr:DegT/DnrJ/EryC1/StrS family aminotransferase [Nodosilinea sp. TSF1-S3]MDF0367092.1 DegT/DnrJ/EryC1/StrS family aminotransferase [Nodosilinea sp. TSF1-S3]